MGLDLQILLEAAPYLLTLASGIGISLATLRSYRGETVKRSLAAAEQTASQWEEVYKIEMIRKQQIQDELTATRDQLAEAQRSVTAITQRMAAIEAERQREREVFIQTLASFREKDTPVS